MMRRSYWIFLPFIFMYACQGQKKLVNNFSYFQNGTDSLGKAVFKEPVIQPNDLLSIQVYSGTLSQEQAVLFNLPNAGGAGMQSNNAQGAATANGYLVDMDGQIAMPVIGKIKAAGLTRGELAKTVEAKIADYVKNPNVLVRYLQFKVNVIGEVKAPGTKSFNTDRVTLLDALSASGDLTDFGKRENVRVFRETNGERKVYEVDLRNASFFQSPAYQLQQNDVVYVDAINNKLKLVNANPNVQRDISLVLSLLSGVAILLNTYILLTR
ncbi:polysaccharide biosynthesis/export family protein [Sediminibacterium ginsengisoli]|uniref:Polysaccharide export outer membrane protein n=1 Tax=Sediminibacterium ginsengisoli TaxID=413434 RepID=A0A1T4Q6I0_9BACT|nr:polysaccharide biosynthesis/export family protein [Sediminibacterium ginsengisoli]SJZ99294.1 polysaccharide export outer membrane protein [Sediminibacterium ginsengisoli]